MNETTRTRPNGTARRNYLLMCVAAIVTMAGLVTSAVVFLLQ